MATLFYIMGVSGSGKDTLLDAAFARLSQQPEHRRLLPRRAQRYITRDADAGGEEHQAVSVTEFEELLQAGRFCMNWQAHGFHYGIPVDIIDWLAEGSNVLLNGSRAYLADARQVMPDLVPVLIDVSASTQKKRLQNRQRESEQAIQARLARRVDLGDDKNVSDAGIVVINNEQALDESVRQLCELIIARS